MGACILPWEPRFPPSCPAASAWAHLGASCASWGRDPESNRKRERRDDHDDDERYNVDLRKLACEMRQRALVKAQLQILSCS